MNIEEFGKKIKSKYPEYNDMSDADIGSRMLNKYPEYKDVVGTNFQGKVESASQNPVMKVVDFLAPAIKTNANVVANQMDYQSRMPNTKGDLLGSVKNAAMATGNLASQLPKAALDDALTMLGAKGLKQVATHPVQSVKAMGGALKTVVNPIGAVKSYAGGQAEKAAARAGNVSAEALEKKFGTFMNPNRKMVSGEGSLASLGEKNGLINELKKEILAQGRSGGGVVPQPTFADILNARKGAYKEAYDNLAPAAQRGLKKNIGRAYKEILHENVPGMKTYDQLYSAMSTLEKSIPGILKWAGILGGAATGVGYLGSALKSQAD